MRIHSDFKDYYDTALGYGVDPSLHYNRKGRHFYPSHIRRQLPAEMLRRVEREIPVRRQPGMTVGAVLVGFCGKVYPCVRVRRGESAEYIYTPEALTAFADAEGLRREGYTRRKLSEFVSAAPAADDEIFRELAAPLFVVSYDADIRAAVIDTNVMLKQYQFFKVVDAFTAFQELSRYLGNELVKRDEVLEVADRYKIAQHGYDRHSFRKQKAVA